MDSSFFLLYINQIVYKASIIQSFRPLTLLVFPVLPSPYFDSVLVLSHNAEKTGSEKRIAGCFGDGQRYRIGKTFLVRQMKT